MLLNTLILFGANKMTKKINIYILVLFLGLLSKIALAAPYVIEMSRLGFSEILPITGNCGMNIEGIVTDLPGSQMCISSEDGTIAHYRIIAVPDTNFNIQVKSRTPVNSDGITFTPVGKIISDVDDIDIIPGQAHVANSGSLGRVDIKFGGQIILSRQYGPSGNYEIEMEALIIWSEQP
jgi:hypothetical protein